MKGDPIGGPILDRIWVQILTGISNSLPEVREQLMRDQGNLCAYCQRRIPCTMAQPHLPDMHVEHWRTQSHDDESTRQWSNLLAVCPGNPTLEDGSARESLHCDTSRGNAPLFLHPVYGQGPDPRKHLRYDYEGGIHASDGPNEYKVNNDLRLLNLDAPRLRRILRDLLRDKLKTGGFKANAIRDFYRRYAPKQDANSLECCQVARFYLTRWARQQGITLE